MIAVAIIIVIPAQERYIRCMDFETAFLLPVVVPLIVAERTINHDQASLVEVAGAVLCLLSPYLDEKPVGFFLAVALSILEVGIDSEIKRAVDDAVALQLRLFSQTANEFDLVTHDTSPFEVLYRLEDGARRLPHDENDKSGSGPMPYLF